MGSFSSMKASSPKLARPMAFSIPESVSTILGVGFPFLGMAVILFVMNPPSELILVKSASSSAYPQVPEAVNTGFVRRRPAKSSEMSIFSLID